MKICFFGTYDKKYSSNKIVLDGFQRNHVDVIEINNNIRITPLNNSSHLSLISLVKRVLVKLSLIPLSIKNWNEIKTSDAIYVGYPGHLDVLLAYLLAKVLNKKLIFYPLIILYITFTEDVNLFSKKSIYAKLLKMYEKIIYKLPDLIYADIPFQKKIYVEDFGVDADKISEIPIGADDLIYKYSGILDRKGDFNIVYYGLYSPLHGIEHLMNAALILRNQTNIKFLMVGDGQTYEEHYTFAKKNHLNNVIFYKNATEDNAMQLLAKADIFMGLAQNSPTVYRTLPNKVYQGLALGKVVLTADSPASRGVFTHLNDAYLFTAADPKSLAEGILGLHNEPELVKKIASNGYKLFVDQFTPHQIAKKIEKDIKALLVTNANTVNAKYDTV